MSAIAQRQSSTFKLGWGLLLFLAVGTMLGHLGLLLFDPGFEVGFIGWATFELLLAAIVAIPYRRGERWAWTVVWAVVIPYGLVMFFNPEIGPYYLGMAVLTAIGQALTYSAFFGQGARG